MIVELVLVTLLVVRCALVEVGGLPEEELVVPLLRTFSPVIVSGPTNFYWLKNLSERRLGGFLLTHFRGTCSSFCFIIQFPFTDRHALRDFFARLPTQREFYYILFINNLLESTLSE